MNYFIGIGRLTKDPKIKELENGKKVGELSIAIKRSYKNSEGIYETDFIDCSVWNTVAEKVCEYCKKGDLISIKGRIESYLEDIDGKKEKKYRLQGEQVSFMSQKSQEVEDKDDLEV